jgi:hypothetical protein
VRGRNAYAIRAIGRHRPRVGNDMEIVPAGRVGAVLTTWGERLGVAEVMALVTRAHTMLRPA